MLREYLELWNALDQKRLDATFQRWFKLVLQLINDHRAYSHAVAARYMADMRRQAGLGPAPVAPLAPLDPGVAEETMRIATVPVIKKQIGDRKPPQEAMERGFINSAGRATKLAMDPGRDTVVETVKRDRDAVGWYRLTDGDPCWFCAMLASAGVRYKSEQSASFEPHDHCGCSAVAVYSKSEQLPESNRQYADLWRRVTRGLKGKDAQVAFRRAIEGR